MLRIHKTEEWKENISKALKGKKFTEEHRQNVKRGKQNISEKTKVLLSESHKKLYQSGYIHPQKGKKLSEDWKNKLRLARIKGLNSGKIKIWNKGRVGVYSKDILNKMSKSKEGWIMWHTGKKLSKEKYPNYGFRKTRKTQILPVKDTSIEVKIQNFLKQLGIAFFTHQHIKIEHSYQCDILIPSMNVVIECDGDYWHKYPVGRNIDYIRTKELLEKGFKVLRLWEHEINSMDLNNFKNTLWNK